MRLVGEAVDDGNRGLLRELLDVRLRKRADHDRVEVTGENRCRIADRLPAAELEVAGRQVQADTAELVHPDLEGDAGAGGGLLEDHPERPPRKEVMRLPGALEPLQLVREIEGPEQIGSAPVGDSCKGASFQAVADGDHGLDPTPGMT